MLALLLDLRAFRADLAGPGGLPIGAPLPLGDIFCLDLGLGWEEGVVMPGGM